MLLLIADVTDDTDIGLLARLRSDPAAVELFYRRHRARVLAYAISRCRQPADVADVVAATFLAALEKPEAFDPQRGEAGAWLIGIAARQWLLLCRAERKQQLLRAEVPPWAPSDADIVRLEEQVDAARASEPAWAALEQVAPGHQEVLRLVGPGGLTAREAAKALGISAGVTALGSRPRTVTAPAPAAAGPSRAGAFLTAKLSASLASEASYMITSRVTQAATGEKLTSWLDPGTGSRRLLLTSAAGTPETAEGVVLRGANATVTTLDYATRTAVTRTEPAAVIQAAQRLGVNVPSPADIRRELSSATVVSEGEARVDGHQAYRVRLVVPPASQAWFRGDDVELYVDTSTYQLVRVTISYKGTLTDTDDLTWTPLAEADLARTRLAVPPGFTSS